MTELPRRVLPSRARSFCLTGGSKSMDICGSRRRPPTSPTTSSLVTLGRLGMSPGWLAK
jgi:hypothetical protein